MTIYTIILRPKRADALFLPVIGPARFLSLEKAWRATRKLNSANPDYEYALVQYSYDPTL